MSEVLRRRSMTIGGVYWLLVFAYLFVWGRLSNESPLFFDDGALYAMADARNVGAQWFDGIVENRPPLLAELIAWTLSVSPATASVKWLSVAVFGLLLVIVYLALRRATHRNDLAYSGVTLIVANFALKHYGLVEVSTSYWQAMVCLVALLVMFAGVTWEPPGVKGVNGRRAALVGAGVLWAIAMWLKQQAVVALVPVAVLAAMSTPVQPAQRWLAGTIRVLSLFAVGALLASIALYFVVLPHASWEQAYKYLVQANMARNELIQWTHEWIARKTAAVALAAETAARVPIAALICLEALRIFSRVSAWLSGRTAGGMTTGGRFPEAASDERPVARQYRSLTYALIAWAVTALAFYSLQQYAQVHYLMEIGFSVALLCPLLLGGVRRYQPWTIAAVNVCVLALLVVWHGIVRDPIDVADRDRAAADANLASIIRANSTEQDRLLVFGPPALYQLSSRSPASRFPFFSEVWTTPLLFDEYLASVERGLEAATTKIVVVDDLTWNGMPVTVRSVAAEEIRTKYRKFMTRAYPGRPESFTVYLRETAASDVTTPTLSPRAVAAAR